MKQCILIMAHKDVSQVRRLVAYFQGKCDVIVHLDKSSRLSREDMAGLASMPGVRKVFRKISVHWGGFSIVRCQLFLFEQGMRLSDARYFHLLSGQDYPLKPLQTFLDFFEHAGQEFIGGVHLPNPNWDGNTYKRIQHFYFMDWLRFVDDKVVDKAWSFADWQDSWGIRRGVPRQVRHLYGGSAWFSLTRNCVGEVIRYTHKHPSLLRRFKFTFAPDELYFQTVVRHIDFAQKQVGQGNLRHIHWRQDGDNHPIVFNEGHFYELSSSEAMFGRKFCMGESGKVMDLLDKYLLTREAPSTLATGAWDTRTFVGHFFDGGLATGIATLCRICKLRNAIDLGCGPGWYVTALRKSNVAAVGYDGNPNTTELSHLMVTQERYPCEQADLTDELVVETPYDLAICLAVGEYIPPQYERRVWTNLVGATKKYLIVGWAAPDVCGKGIVNPHTESEIKETGLSYGLSIDELATHMLRERCWLSRYRKSILVFTRQNVEK